MKAKLVKSFRLSENVVDILDQLKTKYDTTESDIVTQGILLYRKKSNSILWRLFHRKPFKSY